MHELISSLEMQVDKGIPCLPCPVTASNLYRSYHFVSLAWPLISSWVFDFAEENLWLKLAIFACLANRPIEGILWQPSFFSARSFLLLRLSSSRSAFFFLDNSSATLYHHDFLHKRSVGGFGSKSDSSNFRISGVHGHTLRVVFAMLEISVHFMLLLFIMRTL